jgi:hypothetical protein
MKRPKIKRAMTKKPLAPQQQVATSPKPGKQKKPRGRKKKPLTPQQEAAAAAAAAAPQPQPQQKKRGRLGAPLRLLGKPFRKVAGLKGTTRLIVWAVLAIVVVFGALQLRGGRDDDKLVRAALERYEKASAEKDVQVLCDELLASSYVKQTASSGLPCEVALRTALEDVRNPTLDVVSVEVNGDRAAARVRGSAAGQVPGEAVYTLVREDDSWRILPPRPTAASAAP